MWVVPVTATLLSDAISSGLGECLNLEPFCEVSFVPKESQLPSSGVWLQRRATSTSELFPAAVTRRCVDFARENTVRG